MRSSPRHTRLLVALWLVLVYVCYIGLMWHVL